MIAMTTFIRLDGHTIVASAVAAWKEIPGIPYMGEKADDRVKVILVGGQEITGDMPAGEFGRAMGVA